MITIATVTDLRRVETYFFGAYNLPGATDSTKVLLIPLVLALFPLVNLFAVASAFLSYWCFYSLIPALAIDAFFDIYVFVLAPLTILLMVVLVLQLAFFAFAWIACDPRKLGSNYYLSFPRILFFGITTQ